MTKGNNNNKDDNKKKDKKGNSNNNSSSVDVIALFVKNWKYILQMFVVILGIVFASTLFQVNR